jgi:hypothetical protein
VTPLEAYVARRRLVKRRNPMPMTGAIFLTRANGKRRARKGKKASPFRRLSLKLNGRKRGSKRRSTRKNRWSVRRNRRNGIALRMNRKRKGSRRRKTKRNSIGRGTVKWNRKRRSRKAKRNGRKGRSFRRRSTKRNGIALRMNRRKGRKGKRRTKRNGLALRMNRRNGRKGGKRRFSRKNRSFRRNRKNGIALRMNRGRKGGFRRSRRYGTKRNGSKRNGFRRNRRNGIGVTLRRNGVKALLSPISLVTSLVKKVPFVGKRVAPFIAPVAIGATALVGVHLALTYGSPYLAMVVPAEVLSFVAPATYTLGGIAVGALLQFAPFLSKGTKKALAGAMVVGGAGVDAYRYVSTDGMLGDGGFWQLGSLGGSPSYGDADGAALAGAYGDALPGDAVYSGPDLDPVEGEAAIAGASAWRRRFIIPLRATRVQTGASKHAAQHGHRWGWLIKMVGFDKFRSLASQPASVRVAYIKQLREHAIKSVPLQIESAPAESLGSPYGALVYAGGDY